MSHHKKDPITQIAGFASAIAVVISISCLNHSYHRYDFFNQNVWYYWAVVLLTIKTSTYGAYFITKKLLQHQSPKCLKKWGKRVSVLELTLLILAIIILYHYGY